MTDPYAPADAPRDPAGPGTVVGGRYTLRTAVGHGGMGTVWHATDTQLGRSVAVKEVVPPPGISQEDREAMYQRMLREARAAAAMSHPGVVQVYDVVTDGSRPWVVMELLEARSLSDMVLRDGPLAPRAVAKIGVALLGALEVAHAHGVLHRDVKPANVLICTDGRCVLTDFGVARVPTDEQLTTPGMVLGSPHFISPERAMGKPFGPPSDLFSLGVTLYAAVEGRPPFDKGEPIATMHAVVEEEPPPTERAGPLGDVLQGLLEKDPHRRWDAATARDALRELLAGPLASPSSQYPTDPYSVVPAQRPASADAPAADRTHGHDNRARREPSPAHAGARGQIGGRALLPHDDTDDTGGYAPHRGGYGDGEGALLADTAASAMAAPPERYARAAGPSTAGHPSTADHPATAGHPAPGRHGAEYGGAEYGGVRRAPGSSGQGAGQRAGAVAERVTGTTMHGATAAAALAGRGWRVARRAPRQAQVAAAAGLAMVMLITVAWLVTGDEDEGDITAAPPDPQPSRSPVATAPPDEMREYHGRGVAFQVPAGWETIDNEDLSYVDFVDPERASSALRLVVEPWGGEPAGLVQIAEENIQQNSGCPDPYERLSLTDTEAAGLAGAELRYTCGDGDEQRRARWVTVVRDETAYSLRLTAEETVYEQWAPHFAETLRSLQFVDDTAAG